MGIHADTVENASDKIITFGFDYKTSSIGNGNFGTEMVVFSTDSDDVTWSLWTDNGATLHTSASGMSANALYHIAFTIDNSKNTINCLISDEDGNIVNEASLTNSGNVDVNTLVFRTGKGVTDIIDNFYCTVQDPNAVATPTPTVAPTPTPTPTVKPTTAPTGPNNKPPATAPPNDACFFDFWLLEPVVFVTVRNPSFLIISAPLISVKGYVEPFIETIPSVKL